jgi:hypothetical protein
MSALLAKRQQQLMAYLQGTPSLDEGIHTHIVKQGNVDTHKRLKIYQNAYQLRLKETIDTDHNILGLYLGDEWYEQMMNGFIALNPSQQFSLRHFADPLINFLNQQAPFNDHPQIAELARFERLLLSAFDALDTPRATLEQLKATSPENWPNIQLRFHPSLQIFKSHWNVVTMWQCLKQDNTPPEPVSQENAWLVWRNIERLTEFRPLDPVALTMLNGFQTGLHFEDICQELLKLMPEHQVSERALSVIVDWLELGIIHKIICEPIP